MTTPISKRRQALVFFVAAAIYGATSYAGIRSPDSEIVFETCDALLHRHSFAVTGESTWEGFGLAPGRDGGLYPVFGPLQPLACVPFLAVADRLNGTRWFERVVPPRSHYIDGGARAVLTRAPIAPVATALHARRALVAWWFNTLVAAGTVLLFLRLCSRVSRHQVSAVAVTCAYGLGSLMWPYSGTFFSEPLAMSFLIFSFDALLACRNVGAAGQEERAEVGRSRIAWGLCAGTGLGLAAAAHLSAILFLPFWLGIAAGIGPRRSRALAGACVLGGALAILAVLGLYNHAHFGSLWETGRSFEPERFGYGVYQAPWRALWDLLLSPGKGLLLFCPVVLLGLAGWKPLAARTGGHRVVAWALAAALIGRYVFIASRSDWHGGFCLGPRYLLLALPFALFPAVAWLDELVDAKRWRALTAALVFAWACTLQQAYFVVGEIFSFLHAMKLRAIVEGHGRFMEDDVYRTWRYSPLFRLLEGFRGPFLLEGSPVGNSALWLEGALLLSIAWWTLGRAILAHEKSTPTSLQSAANTVVSTTETP